MPVGLSLSGVSRHFDGRCGRVAALSDVSPEVAPGAFTALIGPSGCGKSTLLRLAVGLDRADAGQIAFGGIAPVEAARKGLTGIAFQDAVLLPWRSVEDNIALPFDVLRRPHDRARIVDLIALVGLSGFENRCRASVRAGCASASPSPAPW